MRISVIGLGKLGAPLLAVLADAGHSVSGYDKVQANVDFINDPSSDLIKEPGLKDLLVKHANRVMATSQLKAAIVDTDVSFVIVPTPSNDDNPRFDNKFVVQAMTDIGKALKKVDRPHLVVIVSTVMPGSTDGPIREALEKAMGANLNEKRVGLCYSPEFIALGTVVRDMQNPDVILIGESSPEAGDLLEQIQRSVAKTDPKVHRMSIVNAEIAKIALNTYITMKISYANQLAEICEGIEGADARVIARAVGDDSRVGPKYIQPAVSFGGPCFPRDNKAFFALGLDAQVISNLADATDRINDRQVSRLAVELANYEPSLRIGIFGLSYKADSYVAEKSFGVRLFEELRAFGRKHVYVFDPLVKEHASIPEECFLTHADQYTEIAVLATPWPEFKEYSWPGKIVFDCWDLLPDSRTGAIVHKVGVYRDHVS